MLVQRFREWSRTAPVEDRARAVAKVCEAFRFATVPENERRTGVAVMTVALDDPSPKVRLALSKAIAPCADAPRHVVMALARDLPAIAAPVLNTSPLLADAELVPLVAAGDEACALAVAARSSISVPLARAIVVHGGADAVLRLLDHAAVVLGAEALERIAARFGERADIRSRLLAHQALAPRTARHLAALHAERLTASLGARGWLSPARAARLAAEARERHLLDASASGDLAELVADAVAAGHVTSALLVRAAVEGHLRLVEAIVAELAAQPVARVASAFRATRSHALDAVLLRAGIASEAREMIAAAHRIWCESATRGDESPEAAATRILRRVVRALSSRVTATTSPPITRLVTDLELEIERHAALHHEEQVLLAA